MSNGRTCSSCGQLLPESATECPRCSPETQGVLAALPSISGYKIQGLIGRGGMGSVYLAEDQTLGRRTAVKLLSETLSQDEQAKTRFLREARSMATVEHPNIVRVYGFGEAGGQTYLVMEYVEGKTLAQRIQEAGRLPVEEALRILKQSVEGLESAWEKGIVHRDIKPANILIDAKGRVRVADFGLAKPVQMQGDSSLSHTGLVLGTPNYISPEQIQGQKVDLRAKVRIVNQDGSNLRAFQKSDLSKDSLSVSWAPDTNILYQRSGNRNFSVLNPETETERPLVQDDSVGWMFDPCYSPDGKQVAVYWNRKSGFGKRGLWIISMNDGFARLLKEGNIYPIGWSADAKWVYAFDEQGIVKISIQAAESERMPQIQGWEKVWKGRPWWLDFHLVDMSRNEKSFVMNFFDQQSDVWVVENFDPEAAREK